MCQKPIQWFCAECKQWFCNDCKTKHAKFKATRSHKLSHIQAVAREHRSRIEKLYSDIKKAEEKLGTVVESSSVFINRLKEQETVAVRENDEARQEVLDLVNARFDEIEQKITGFSDARKDDLNILKLKSETLLLELTEKSAVLSGFLTKLPAVIVTKGGQITSEYNEYLGMTTIPRVEFKDYSLQFKKGTKFVPQAVGSYDLRGGFTQVNVPIVLRNILKHVRHSPVDTFVVVFVVWW